ncbi:MAG TPA: glycerol-3-phosphate 1-O-acyltransferase PlsY [Haliangiales bacterium]|nr:glycerol-3-phosphate 1-O-acyltransferase PlsY [Haliangiales bacterium]
MVVVLLCAAAYVAGSIPFGLLIARAKGVDIRAAGSGNIGATNVARVVGKPLGVLVLVLDAAKGFGPTFAALRVAGPEVAAVAGILAIVGHVFPVWLRFRGGKGVATALGVFLALAPIEAGVAFGTYAVVYGIWRISSVGSLCGGAALLAAMGVRGEPAAILGLGGAAFALIVWRHRGNIRRILKREEKRV